MQHDTVKISGKKDIAAASKYQVWNRFNGIKIGKFIHTRYLGIISGLYI
jgi:hypothetical protein